MLYSLNDPVGKFVQYANRYYKTEEKVCIVLVDASDPIMKNEDGEQYYGTYIRFEDGPHMILLMDCLDSPSLVEAVVHEYAHHLLWEESKMNLSEEELHDDEFWDKVEELKDGFFAYLEHILDDSGLIEFVEKDE